MAATVVSRRFGVVLSAALFAAQSLAGVAPAAADGPALTLTGARLEVDQDDPISLAATGIANFANPATPITPGDVNASGGGTNLVSAALGRMDIRDTELGAVPIDTLGLERLPVEIPLSTIPVVGYGTTTTWATLLATSPLGGLPLGSVTFKQVMALAPGDFTDPYGWDRVHGLWLENIDWSGSLLRDVPLAALALGSVTVNDLDLGGSGSTLVQWCAAIDTCTSPSTLDGTTLLELGVRGASMDDIPLKNVPLKNVDLSTSPLKNVPLKNVVLGSTPLKNVPLKNVDVRTSPLKNVPLKNVAWTDAGGVTPSPLKNVPLKNVDWTDPGVTDGGGTLVISPLKNVPLKNVDLAFSPLGALPLKNVDFGTAPLKNVPLKNVDLAYAAPGGLPLKNVPLKNVAWAQAPLKNVPLKNVDVAATPLRNVPLKNVAAAGAPLKNVPLKNVAWAQAPLKNVPLKNVALAASGLGALPLDAIDWAQAPAGVRTSDDFATGGAPFTGTITPGTTLAGVAGGGGFAAGATLAELEAALLPAAPDLALGDLRLDLAGAAAPAVTLGDLLAALAAAEDPALDALLPLPAGSTITLGDLGLDLLADTGMTLGDLVAALTAAQADALTLGDLRLDLLASDTLLAVRDLAALLVGSGGNPAPDPLLGDLRLDLVTGGKADALLLEAVFAYAMGGDMNLFDGWVLGSLTTFVQDGGADVTLGDLGTWTDGLGQDITLGDLAQYLPASVSIVDVLLGLVPSTDFPYESFPTRSIGLQRADASNGNQYYPPEQRGRFTTTVFATIPTTSATDVDAVISVVLPLGTTLSDDPNLNNYRLDFDPNLSNGTRSWTTSTRADGRQVVRVHVSVTRASEVGFPALFSATFTNPLRLGLYGDVPVTLEQPGAPDQDAIAADTGEPVVDVTEPNANGDPADPRGHPAQGPVLLPFGDSCPAGTSCTTFDTLAAGFLGGGGDRDWFLLRQVRAGSRISVTLTNLPADADLVLYGPLDESFSPVGGVPVSAFPPARTGLPGALVDDPGLGVGQRANGVAAEALTDLRLEPGLPVLSISQHPGREDETVGAIAPADGNYGIQVTGYNAVAAADAYTLRAKVVQEAGGAACAAVTETLPLAPAETYPADANALFLTLPGRMDARYGTAARQGVDDALGRLVTYLGDHPQLGIRPAVVRLDAHPSVLGAYQQWDLAPCDVARANGVVRAITGVLAAIEATHPGVSYLTIVGGDDLVPMGRVPDLTRISNEREYAATFPVGTSNALLAAMNASDTLTDDVYGDTAPTSSGNGNAIYVPTLAVGRLVETPAEIAAALDEYRTAGGGLNATTGLVAGYDFLADGADAVATRLATPTRTVDRSLAGGTNAANHPWTAADLLGRLFPAGGATPVVASVNAHYDHQALLPAAGDAGTSSQLVTAADLRDAATAGGGLSRLAGRILFTMGCHAGLNVPDDLLSGGAANPLALDWAQSLAQQDVAVFVANTGYGIGDTGAVAYSERLMGLYAKLLDGSLTAGQALAYAKQAYFGSLAAVGVYDAKILQQTAFYGLPFWKLGAGADPVTPPAPPTLPGTLSTDAATGLASLDLTVHPVFERRDTDRGSYWLVKDSPTTTEDPQVVHYRPIQPRTTRSILATGTGLVAHGALVTALQSDAVAGVDPVLDTPTADLGAASPEVSAAESSWPARLATIRSYTAPYGAAQDLVLVPGQFLGSPVTTGTQRLFTSVTTRVLYAPAAVDDVTEPAITQATGAAIGSAAGFRVVTGDASGIARVLVAYLDPDGTWRFTDLVAGPDGWTGGGTLSRELADGETIEWFVQAVDGAGNVATSSSKARGYRATLPPAPATGTLSLAVDPPVPASGWLTGPATVSAQSSTSAPIELGSDREPFLPRTTLTVSADGITTVNARANDGATASVVVAIDGTDPSIAATDDLAYPLGALATGTFSCDDAGSGIASCTADAIDTATPTAAGTHRTYTVTATDHAGRTATRAVRYTVEGTLDQTPPSITASVSPAPNAAGWNRATVTVHFDCSDAESGLAPGACPADVTVSADAVTTVTRSVSDLAGNSASASATVRLDTGAPAATPSLSPAANAAGWNKGPVTVGWTCSDPAVGGVASGVASCPASTTIAAQPGGTATGTVTDVAGNATPVSRAVKIDTTAPVVTLTGVPNAPACSTTDALSGVATPATLTVTTTPVNGVPKTTATCAGATDVAGNAAAPVSQTYTPLIQFLGYLSPVANPPVINVTLTRTTIPMRFQLKDGNGAILSSLSAVASAWYKPVSCLTFTGTAAPVAASPTLPAGLTWSGTTKAYTYGWKSPAKSGCYTYWMTMADGRSWYALFILL